MIIAPKRAVDRRHPPMASPATNISREEKDIQEVAIEDDERVSKPGSLDNRANHPNRVTTDHVGEPHPVTYEQTRRNQRLHDDGRLPG